MIVIMIGIALAIPLMFVHAETAWFVLAVFGLYGLGDELARIQALLLKLFVFSEWLKILEAYRFEKQYPNATEEWQAAQDAMPQNSASGSKSR